MQFIPNLNFMCTRHNVALCEQIIHACATSISRRALGKQLAGKASSSVISRLLFSMKEIGVLVVVGSNWQVSPRITGNSSGLPFVVVPVDGLNAEILRLFGAQYSRRKRTKGIAGQPPMSMTIRTIGVVLNVSREVLQLRLAQLLELGLIKRQTNKKPYHYELNLNGTKTNE